MGVAETDVRKRPRSKNLPPIAFGQARTARSGAKRSGPNGIFA